VSEKISFKPTRIPEVMELQPRVFEDERGFFLESWNLQEFRSGGLDAQFVQDNHSQSTHGILRGLHYQIRRPQGKLVRVVIGRVFDVAVDLRRSSPTLGQWVGVWLSAKKKNMLWIPPGFAHGFYVESRTADLLYKCTELYFPEDDRTVCWNDPDLAIEWPLSRQATPILSAKDSAGTRFSEAELYP
jgi:dTDP-4-dehydrorhamnose 3,5-epimerase